jgi:hypothetical protein
LLGIAGICGELWTISAFCWLLAGICRALLAFVDALRHLWTISWFDACGFGFWGRLLGNHDPVFGAKCAVEVHKLCG